MYKRQPDVTCPASSCALPGATRLWWHAVRNSPEDEAAVNKAFPFEDYPDENAAAQDLKRYHEEHLRLHGIKLGRGGFAVKDLHKQYPLHFTHGCTVYKGGVDAALVPFGVHEASAHQVMRIGWEHKQSSRAKLIFQLQHPDRPQVRPKVPELTLHEHKHTASAS